MATILLAVVVILLVLILQEIAEVFQEITKLTSGRGNKGKVRRSDAQ